MDGISRRQGGHQAAQKFTSTTLPWYCAMSCAVPDKSGRARLGGADGVNVRKLALAIAWAVVNDRAKTSKKRDNI
jgi:hypothetical protein